MTQSRINALVVPPTWEHETTDDATTHPPPSPVVAGAYLLALAGSRTGTVVRLGEQTRIGRDPQAELRAYDDGLSRFHAVLECRADGTILRDLGSRNGSFVNGAAVSEVLLVDGDTIRTAGSVFKYLVGVAVDEFERNVYRAALFDPLTELYSPRFFAEQLRIEYRLCRRHNQPLGVMLVDVDRMTLVNHGFGMSVGDQVVAALGRIVREVIREEDLAARVEGQRIAVLCRMTALEGLTALASRLRRAVDERTLFEHLPQLKITVSVGVAALPELRAPDGEALVAAAHAALRQAKSLGRNRIASART